VVRETGWTYEEYRRQDARDIEEFLVCLAALREHEREELERAARQG
jgi:hypothetical protein